MLCRKIGVDARGSLAQIVRLTVILQLFRKKAGIHAVGRREDIVRQVGSLDVDAVGIKGKVSQQKRQQRE